MTRINVVPPAELTRQHLLAEYRELPRVFTLIRNFKGDVCHIKAPAIYVLGRGHLKFFYTRATWLVRRHDELVEEMQARGYETNIVISLAELHRDLPSWAWRDDYVPTKRALRINRERIWQRLNNK